MKTNEKNMASDLNLIIPMFLILTIVAFISSSQYFFFLFHGDYSFVNYLNITFSKLIYFYYFILLASLLSISNSRLHLERKRLLVWISSHGILLVTSFIVHQAITFFVDKLILNENSSFSYSDTLLRNPDAWIDIVAYILLLAGILLLDSKRISKENEIKCAQLEAMVIKSKLQELRTRIHPQFLFKTLGTIKTQIAKEKNREANNVLSMLSDFLRTTVYESSKDEIELVEELQFLNTYLSIEKAAFDGAIVYKENIASDSRNALVPIFLIQPIVESLLYELASETNSAFDFYVESVVQNSNLRIMLVTKLVNEFYLSAYTIENLEAIKVVKERLKQFFDSNSSFEINCTEENIIGIRISFPFKENYGDTATTFLMEN